MSVTGPIKVLIVGYGRVGRRRAERLVASDDWDLVGVCDLDATKKDGATVPFHTDWRSALEAGGIDAVFACAVNSELPEIVTAALKKGHHVFCEKPPGRNLEDAERMKAAADAAPQCKVKFGFNHRYHDAVEEAKALIDGGRLGKVLWLRGVYGKAGGSGYDREWRNDPAVSGGGILLDQGIHMVDLFEHLCGDFDEVKSFIGNSYWKIPVEDNAFALLRNANGQVAALHSSATQWRHRFLLDIYLEKGYLSLEGILSSTRSYGRESLRIARCLFDEEGYPLANPQESSVYYDEDLSWSKEIDEFARCILDDQPVETGTAEDAVRTMRLVQKIYSADQTWKKPVEVEK